MLNRLLPLLNSRSIRAFLKVMFYYTLIKMLIFLVGFILSAEIFGISAIEFNLAEDVNLNDLHYKINSIQKYDTLQHDIILINSGSLSTENFRGELAELLTLLNFYEPKVVGIDVNFKNDVSRPGTEQLLSILSSAPHIIMAKSAKDTAGIKYPENLTYGYVDFPEQPLSLRRYYSHDSTFAFKTAVYFDHTVSWKKNDADSSMIHYVANYPAEIDLSAGSACFNNFQFSKQVTGHFPMVEGGKILNGGESTDACLTALFKNKIILIGHIHNNCIPDYRNDLEDKHAVPLDTNIVHRQKTMPGLMVHANAIENLLNPSIQFSVWSDTWWYAVLMELLIITFLCFLIFVKAGKLINILFLFILSIPALFMVLYLMQCNIYIQMGATLLQLLIFEEMVEILEPLFEKLKRKTIILSSEKSSL